MDSTRTVAFSENHVIQYEDKPIPDIDVDGEFLRLFEKVRAYSMVNKDAMYALYNAVHYVLDREIPGDFVECGVWKGGSSLLVSLILQERGETGRSVYLYDTFAGMPPPTDDDVDMYGAPAAETMEANRDDIGWCYATRPTVEATFAPHTFDFDVHLVEGDVVETLRETWPETVALLRLDTDWYESTRAELVNLYPRVSPGGILIIDDYGHWEGARKATDEYFKTVPPPLLVRVNYSVRLAVKV